MRRVFLTPGQGFPSHTVRSSSRLMFKRSDTPWAETRPRIDDQSSNALLVFSLLSPSSFCLLCTLLVCRLIYYHIYNIIIGNYHHHHSGAVLIYILYIQLSYSSGNLLLTTRPCSCCRTSNANFGSLGCP